MKLRPPVRTIPNSLRDINCMHHVSYKLPNKRQDDSWEEECKLNPTKSPCKIYEV